jgi:hypothetical protein
MSPSIWRFEKLKSAYLFLVCPSVQITRLITTIFGKVDLYEILLSCFRFVWFVHFKNRIAAL